MYNILEKVFFGDTLVLKFRNIQFWNDLIIGGVKYMYEQGFVNGNFGYAMAISVFSLAISIVLSLISRRLSGSEEVIV